MPPASTREAGTARGLTRSTAAAMAGAGGRWLAARSRAVVVPIPAARPMVAVGGALSAEPPDVVAGGGAARRGGVVLLAAGHGVLREWSGGGVVLVAAVAAAAGLGGHLLGEGGQDPGLVLGLVGEQAG